MDTKHFLFVVSNMMPETWKAIAILGPIILFGMAAFFYVAFLKLQFYLRTGLLYDGLSGLAILSMGCSVVALTIGVPLQELFPKKDFDALRAVCGIGFYGGIILFTVLRPRTRFGKPKAAVQEGEKETAMR